MEELKLAIREIENFPEQGILFRDITTVLKDAVHLKGAIDAIAAQLDGIEADLIVGPESRGFIFGVPVAYIMGKGFVPARKAGKLPAEKASITYSLEYGTETIEMHRDAIQKGQKVVIVDDLLATGGTCKAITELVEELGGEVAALVFFIELEGLNGRDKFAGYEVRSVIKY